MGIPTDEELKHALETAANMRESGNDEDFLAKSLLSLNYRFGKALKIIELTKIYLHGGQNAIEHAKALKAIEEFDKIQTPKGTPFGLE